MKIDSRGKGARRAFKPAGGQKAQNPAGINFWAGV